MFKHINNTLYGSLEMIKKNLPCSLQWFGQFVPKDGPQVQRIKVSQTVVGMFGFEKRKIPDL